MNELDKGERAPRSSRFSTDGGGVRGGVPVWPGGEACTVVGGVLFAEPPASGEGECVDVTAAELLLGTTAAPVPSVRGAAAAAELSVRGASVSADGDTCAVVCLAAASKLGQIKVEKTASEQVFFANKHTI